MSGAGDRGRQTLRSAIEAVNGDARKEAERIGREGQRVAEIGQDASSLREEHENRTRALVRHARDVEAEDGTLEDAVRAEGRRMQAAFDRFVENDLEPMRQRIERGLAQLRAVLAEIAREENRAAGEPKALAEIDGRVDAAATEFNGVQRSASGAAEEARRAVMWMAELRREMEAELRRAQQP